MFCHSRQLCLRGVLAAKHITVTEHGTDHVQQNSSTGLAPLLAGYRVSSTHANPLGTKTDAPFEVVWDIMRAWVKDHPVKAMVRDFVSIQTLCECHVSMSQGQWLPQLQNVELRSAS